MDLYAFMNDAHLSCSMQRLPMLLLQPASCRLFSARVTMLRLQLTLQRSDTRTIRRTS